ncbi:hypothetical protein CDAR_299361 [Caerostris darwini]|uniref:Uncharacterized protein n=1 Tax=Caerostris darwini TaxID=1538125 RepID=A0AAV4RRU6_9ARAC|nr:hypothetical protein CDAR_299361 [Caerostris darwini]
MFVVGYKLNFKTSEKFQSVTVIKSNPSFGISITLSDRKQHFRNTIRVSRMEKKPGYPIKDKRGSILDAERYVLEGRLLTRSTFESSGVSRGRYRVELKWIGNVGLLNSIA